MTEFCPLHKLTAAAVFIVLLVGASLHGEDNATPQSSTSTIPAYNPPPRPPLAKPPVELFRSLLVMAPAERREFLANRSPEAQKLIMAKVKEYEALKQEQRDLRLWVTELRWYLLPLLESSATNRSDQLALIPDERMRELIEVRLKQWDSLSRDVQKQLLENESLVRFYFELAARTPQQRAEAVTNLPPAAQGTLDQGIHRWQSLTDDQRQAVMHNFYQFFNLTASEKARTLSTLSEAERLQIDKTLNTYEGLNASQRAQCLKSFQKFASLSPAERQEFLKNAQRWERMTPNERQSWRYLVSNVSHQPPVPPGLLPPEPPATPPGAVRTPASSVLVTNAN